MSFLTRRGEGPSFPYAGQPMPPASDLAELGEPYGSIFTSLPADGRVGLGTEEAREPGGGSP